MHGDPNFYVYRYRSAKAVLGDYHELERSEIYFSAPSELNDPMEGFKDLVWSGDEIVWRNFLRHYILCVLQTTGYCLIADEQFDPHILKNIVFWVPQELPDAPIQGIYERVSSEFLAEPVAKKFISTLAARTSPLRRSELTAYLRALHGFAMQIVIKEYRERGLLKQPAEGPPPPSPEKLRRSAVAMMEGVTKIPPSEFPPERLSEALFAASGGIAAQMMLINEYNLPDREKRKPITFLTHRFPDAYVVALDTLVHRDWYVSCFAKTPDNHSMWSTYGDGHRGVCLMFKTTPNTEGEPTLAIERVTGASSSLGNELAYHSSVVPHQLEPVIYSGQYPSIDFFRSLGSISEMHMNNFWYTGEGGTFSDCRNAVYSDNEAWRKAYWHTLGQSALYKTPEWAHEEEYRIVVHSGFDMSTKEKRKLKYRFENLAGIVFGARTNWEDKLKIMTIIDKKCAEARRSDFKFYEVRYLHTESRFQLFALGLLKVRYD